MKISRIPRFLLVITIVCSGCAPHVTTTDKSSRSQLTWNQSDAAKQFHDHIAYLASDQLEGRGTGTIGNNLAAEYIARQFKDAGLQPLGDNNSYFQHFEVTLAQKLIGRPALFICGAPGLGMLYTNFVTLPFSSPDTFDGNVAFAGYGITNKDAKYDDYAGFDAKDKVLLVLRYEPHDERPDAAFGGKEPSAFASFQSKARLAREHNAQALLIVNPPLHHGEQDKFFPFNSVDESQSYGIPMMQISRDLANGMLRAAGAADLATLQNQLDKERKTESFNLKGVKARGTPGLVREKAKTQNVVGVVPGSGKLANEYVVIGAHFDHLGIAIPRGPHPSATTQAVELEIHNGADDNASGDAGLILLAQVFARVPLLSSSARVPLLSSSASADAANSNPVDHRSIIFIAFSGEEIGLLGSMYFVNHPTVPLQKIVAMLNMDMIGRLRDNRLQIFGTKTASEFDPMIQEQAKEQGFVLQTSSGGFGPSDHTSFYAKKIPVLHFFTGIHNDYHRPSDKVDKINAQGGARVVGMVATIADKLIHAKQRPTYIAVAETQPARTHMKVRMGVMPSYAEDDQKGMLIDGVSPASPAERAGLRDGDRLLMIGPYTVNNVYGLMDAMGHYEPGNEADLTVLRNGQRIKLAVKFDAP